MAVHRAVLSKRRSTPRSISDCLGADDSMARLAAHASRLQRLQHQLEAAAPKQLAAHVRIANYRLGKIIIHAANGAIAAKLKQLAPGLLDNFRKTGTEITEIDIKVQPRPVIKRAPVLPNRPEVGTQAKQRLSALAQRLPEGDRLRAVLERMIVSAREPEEKK